MNNWLINVSDLPTEGRDFSFTDPAFWSGRFAEFGLNSQAVRPLEAEIHILPQPEGALVRGTLRGAVRLSCDRCTGEYDFSVDTAFELFESLPDGEEPEQDCRVHRDEGILFLDIGALLWEEFILSLPTKPLCNEACKGICPKCGQNFNEGSCDCARDGGDPRLAVFRDLKLK
ncbi:MAG: DUF177 domain-containing protein [Desulfovibrio sp.]